MRKFALFMLLVMGVITFLRPLAEPRRLPERADLDVRTGPLVYWVGGAVIAAVILFFIVFR